jgi:chromosome segregation ATPase
VSGSPTNGYARYRGADGSVLAASATITNPAGDVLRSIQYKLPKVDDYSSPDVWIYINSSPTWTVFSVKIQGIFAQEYVDLDITVSNPSQWLPNTSMPTNISGWPQSGTFYDWGYDNYFGVGSLTQIALDPRTDQFLALQAQLATTNDLVKSLKEELDAADQSNTDLTTQLADANARVSALEAQLNANAGADLQPQLDAANARLGELQAQLDTLQGQLDSANAQIAQLESDKVALNDQLAWVTENSNYYYSEMSWAMDYIPRLRDELAGTQNELAAANAANAQLTADKASLNSRIASLNQQAASATASLAAAQAEKAALAASLDAANAHLASLTASLNAAQSANATLTAEVAGLNSALGAAQAHAAQLQADLAAANASFSSQLNAANAANATLTATNANLTNANAALTANLAAANAQVTTLTAQVAAGNAQAGPFLTNVASALDLTALPGATPLAELQNLAAAISGLNPGQKKAIVSQLTGKK